MGIQGAASFFSLATFIVPLMTGGLVLATSSGWANTADVRFYSQKGVDVDVQFSSYIDIEGEQTHALNSASNTATYVHNEILKALNFMSGPLQYTSPNAGPRYDHNVRIHSVQWMGRDIWRTHFSYSGRFIVEKDNWEKLVIYLPINSRQIYQQGQDSRAENETSKNPCVVNTNYLAPHEFWYFWNPHNLRRTGLFSPDERCPLVEGEHYHKIVPTVSMRQHRQHEFSPDYDKLIHTHSSGERQLEILLIYGADKDYEPDGRNIHATDNPETSTDHNAANYVEAIRGLRRRGFEARKWSLAEYRSFCSRDPNRKMEQTIYELTKTTAQGIKVRVLALWGSTSVRDESYPFYCLLSHGMENASFIQYNAHSGMGSSVYLRDLRTRLQSLNLRLHPTRYQVLMFNSCSSYGYYNNFFLGEKSEAAALSGLTGGTVKIDIISNGLLTYFMYLKNLAAPPLNAILDYAENPRDQKSYQRIVRDMEFSPTPLVNVTSDIIPITRRRR